jgi:hypothetical protein
MRRLFLSILLITIFTSVGLATAQHPDELIFKGKTYDLYSNPLRSYYGEDWKPAFWVAPYIQSSGNWRGYVATWEIIDNKLYLTKIDSWFCNKHIRTKNGCRRVLLRDLFGAKVIDGKVAATWFSEELRVPDGKQLEYVHMGYGSIYERDIIFDVKDGKVTKQKIIDNTIRSLPSKQEIYQLELEKLKKKASEEKRVDPALPTIQKANERSESVLITEKGWGVVSVGAKRKVIEAVLGKGEHDGRKYDDVYFVEYPKKGVQISYTNKSDEAYVIFFYNKQTYYGDFITAPVKTDKGVTWSSSSEDVINAYGKPPRDFSDDTGNNTWRRLEYDKMDFLFERGRMTRISVSNEKCTSCKK